MLGIVVIFVAFIVKNYTELGKIILFLFCVDLILSHENVAEVRNFPFCDNILVPISTTSLPYRYNLVHNILISRFHGAEKNMPTSERIACFLQCFLSFRYSAVLCSTVITKFDSSLSCVVITRFDSSLSCVVITKFDSALSCVVITKFDSAVVFAPRS